MVEIIRFAKQGGKLIYADLIEAICEEVLRLISNQHDLLCELLKMPDLLKGIREDGQLRTDNPTVKNWQAIIENEKQKVKKLEMVLAVVGTMKAGKSTTINAIVGREILPNRNQPMTSLPTLIRHKRGQKEPVLSFPKHQPIENMVDDIKEKLSSLKKSNQLESLELYKDKDGKELIQSIIEGNFHQFQDRYDRQENIFKFLKFLNDLMRLAIDSCINIEFPIEQYENIDDLPVIEVEFFHLANNVDQLAIGNFAVLDTPGPNEMVLGEKLRKVLRTQIARASAVLAVVDYGQLKSEAEDKIREEIASQIEQTKDRLFIFVNQFDRKDRNGMTFEEVKRYAAENLLQGRITQERVYPVSALYAYLSNRALNEINEKKCLPDHQNKENLWVEDFAKVALGVFWEDNIQDVNTVINSAKKLFDLSKFYQPIKEVILKAASTSALISMQSATSKMLYFGNSLEDFLELRHGALTKSVEEIFQLIDGLAQDIQEVENAKAKADKALQELINNFLEAAQQEYESTKQELKEALEFYFNEGKKQEKLELEQKEQDKIKQEAEIEKELQNFKLDIFSKRKRELIKLIQGIGGNQQYFQFDPNNPKIQLNSPAKAEDLLAKVNETIISIINDSVTKLELALISLSNSLEQTIPQTITDGDGVGEILENAKKRLQDKGFSLEFNVPELDIEGNDIDFAELLLSSIENSTETITKTEYRQAEGFWQGRISRFFGSIFHNYDWGYKYYQEDEQVSYYVVNMTRIREKVLTSLDISIQELSIKNQLLFDKKLKPLLDEYFNNLKDYLEKFRGDLEDSIENNQLSAEEKKKLKQRISELKERAELHRQDVQTIKQNLK